MPYDGGGLLVATVVDVVVAFVWVIWGVVVLVVTVVLVFCCSPCVRRDEFEENKFLKKFRSPGNGPPSPFAAAAAATVAGATWSAVTGCGP